MNFMLKTVLVTGIAVLSASAASADCGIEKGSVRILANDFPALRHIIDAAAECAGNGVSVTRNQTTEHESLDVPSLSANPAQYTSAFVATSSIQPLLSSDLIRPLDDYVAKYGKNISDKQKISLGGHVMAIAFNVNTQHLFYRADILEQAGVQPPTSYEEIIAAAKIIKDKGLMQYPVGGTYKAGWNLAEEFVNMYLGYDGTFFEPGTAKPSLNNDKGVAALNMMKSLSAYMTPDFLTYDSNALQSDFEAGKVALANFWGSRYGAVVDDQGSTPEIVKAIKVAAAPTVGGGKIPATTLWWDGYTIAKNISDADAVATFQALDHASSTATANAHPDDAVWLMDGYTPGAGAGGVLDTLKAGAKPYPMNPYMGLLHTALGSEIVAFMQGKEDATAALAKVEAAYTAAAKEKGFLK
jgi:multiple sugar transport system substrate-binding protein